MRKLLHLVFAVWKTNRPFDEKHFPWEDPSDTAASTTTPPAAAGATPAANEEAVGHKRDLPAEEVVTTATSTVEPAPAAGQAGAAARRRPRGPRWTSPSCANR